MNNTINSHLNQAGQEIFGCNIMSEPKIKTYKITIKKDGRITQWRAKGINQQKAEDSIKAYVRGEIFFLGCKDITND